MLQDFLEYMKSLQILLREMRKGQPLGRPQDEWKVVHAVFDRATEELNDIDWDFEPGTTYATEMLYVSWWIHNRVTPGEIPAVLSRKVRFYLHRECACIGTWSFSGAIADSIPEDIIVYGLQPR